MRWASRIKFSNLVIDNLSHFRTFDLWIFHWFSTIHIETWRAHKEKVTAMRRHLERVRILQMARSILILWFYQFIPLLKMSLILRHLEFIWLTKVRYNFVSIWRTFTLVNLWIDLRRRVKELHVAYHIFTWIMVVLFSLKLILLVN